MMLAVEAPLEKLARAGAEHAVVWSDPASGLEAILVIDSTRLGPAAGGIRTRAYDDWSSAIDDALALAKAMTVKCALAGLDAGGGKAVVRAHPGLDRRRAFAVIGERIEALGGLFRTAGDLGTTADDLQQVASRTRFVHTAELDLARAVARGLLRSIEAIAALRSGGELESGRRLDGLTVAIQGAGAIGAAVAGALAAAGASLTICDLDPARARAAADRTGARVIEPARYFDQTADVFAPCAAGGVIDQELASRISTAAICGAANNVLASRAAADVLRARGVAHVPDVIASAGAVIDGIGASVMGLADRTPLIDRLGATALLVLKRAIERGLPESQIALELAAERLKQRGSADLP